MALSLGGKSPADKKKKPLPSLLMVASKAGAPRPDHTNFDNKSAVTAFSDGPAKGSPEAPPPAPDAAPPKPPMDVMGKTVKPGTAMFTNQDETCSTCEYFDDAGNEGVGACKKGVPEADYSVSDPTASRCRFYEGKDDATESDEEKIAEGAPEAEAVPA